MKTEIKSTLEKLHQTQINRLRGALHSGSKTAPKSDTCFEKRDMLIAMALDWEHLGFEVLGLQKQRLIEAPRVLDKIVKIEDNKLVNPVRSLYRAPEIPQGYERVPYIGAAK